MTRALKLTAFVGLTLVGFTAPAHAQVESDVPLGARLGLDPTSPEVGTLPGGMTPAYGQKPADQNDWRFDFHGFLTAPLRAGINERENPADGQSETVLHAPPVVPDERVSFSHTGVVATPYTRLNFSYGNHIVTGVVSIVANQATVATGFFDPPSQPGVNDLFLRINPKLGNDIAMEIRAGAFTSRYGIMGEYDEGRYGTPIIARIKGAGENITAAFDLGDFTLMLEQGIKGQTNKASGGTIPDGWNGFANPNEGSTFITHMHGGLAYQSWGTLGLHYVNAFSADEQATGPLAPDGSLTVIGADLRFNLKHWGHLYLAASHTKAEAVGTVSRIIEILNAPGGPGLIDEYLGDESNGNGSLTTFGGQYDLSVGRLLSYPIQFYPDGPDLFLSVFGLQTQVESDDASRDGITKRKFGTELTYSFLSWMAASARYDRVDPDVDEERFSFAVLSPRLIFRTDWTSTDQVVLQYSRWFNGSLTTVRNGYPAVEDVTIVPDEHMIQLSASMWW